VHIPSTRAGAFSFDPPHEDLQNVTSLALVTCQKMPNLYEDDEFLLRELTRRGIDHRVVAWDAKVDWEAFSAILIRTPWDYFERAPEFRAWLAARQTSKVPMYNSVETILWNFDKTYLKGLEAAGLPVVPTVFVDKGGPADVAAIARERGWSDLVVKPTVSGGAYRTWRFAASEAESYAQRIDETLQDCGLMVQPFIREIFEGELSLLFFDGEFSHAVRKTPTAGEYRVQYQYGGVNKNEQVSPTLVAQARASIDHAPALPLYARVDGVVKDGEFFLMELEIFEPLLFLARHRDAPARFVDALMRRLRRDVPTR
jgi:glutathione synthase/RimK-type ligase-like ATP-grasp enzyme